MTFEWVLDVLKGSISSAIMVALIVIPLMVAIEFLKHWDIIKKIAPIFHPVLKALRLPKEAVFPLLAGLFFGLTYGAGVIIQSGRDGVLTKRDLFVISLFLVVCHSLIEDTMLFIAVGANVWLILLVRITLAFLITWGWVLADWHQRNEQHNNFFRN
ncbi:MAG: nucleoside recognition domain-containing protein [Desulfitobacteriaceae bacterium]|nr:nucleoside recognition domain-containing protein [Desulfitobacteriaceae bacterium]MDD4753261.1 nucleoside recognition domain-containing protein [Desulfitobacteriaceae bacterium]